MILDRYLVNNSRERRFLVNHNAAGWEVIEKEDSKVLRHLLRERWQRVERDIQQFETTANELKRSGWVEH